MEISDLPRFVAHQRVFHAEQVKEDIKSLGKQAVQPGDWIVHGPEGPVVLSNAMFKLFFAAIEA